MSASSNDILTHNGVMERGGDAPRSPRRPTERQGGRIATSASTASDDERGRSIEESLC